MVCHQRMLVELEGISPKAIMDLFNLLRANMATRISVQYQLSRKKQMMIVQEGIRRCAKTSLK